ncbi:MAG: hypothetical protein RL266_1526 [Bacteroidota bacterium]
MLVFTAAQAYISIDMAKTEQQPYEVLWKNDKIEARYYPKAVLATVNDSTKSYRASSNQNFRVLAGYIFGGNEKGQSIAMTAPVHMAFNENGSQMSFVMPSNMKIDELPAPNDRGVKFSETEERYVVALQFGGWADDAKIEEHADKLVSTLKTMGIEIQSEPWYMGYNPPFQLINRRNEVAVEIRAEDLEILRML